jgi:CheY-like chemotaxis protein
MLAALCGAHGAFENNVSQYRSWRRRLPASGPQESEPRIGAEVAMGETYRSPRVLVVDDEPTTAWGLQSALTELGFNEVYLAHDLLMGQALLLLRPPELGILDVHIGRDLVFPLAAEFRAKLIPIIFSTGDAPSKLPPEWSTNPIVRKPLNIETLSAALGAVGFADVVARKTLG